MQRLAVENLGRPAPMELGEALHVRLPLLPVGVGELRREPLLDALRPYPEARTAVAARLAALDRSA